MKNSDASVVHIASRDISSYLKPKRKDERLFYEENIQTYTIDNLGYYSIDQFFRHSSLTLLPIWIIFETIAWDGC